MNITKYYSKEDKNPPIFRGRATLQKGYTIVDATEPFYRYVGSNSAKPFPLMVHPEDAECVRDAFEHLDEEPQRLIFRLLCGDGSYRYMYGVFKYNGREQDGFRYIDINMLDIMRIHHRYDSDAVKLIKYRKFMSLSDELYFEYSYITDRIDIFEYINNRSIKRFSDTLANLQKHVFQSEVYTFKQKAEFEGFTEYLSNFAETMELEMDGEIFGLDCGYMRLNGGIVYVNNTKEMMAGTIIVMGEVKKDDKYYMSPHAFDNATGVYNKRAIKEIAMELIANAKNNKVLLSVMDIDDFKNINDTFGHMTGDEIIAKVAEIIRTTLGHRGYVGRFGGDEFMVVTDKVKDADDFSQIFKTIRKNVTWSCGELLSNMEVTLSLGLASYPENATNYDELFKIADKCLYIAKAKGKNRVIVYKPEKHADFDMMTETANKRMLLTYEQACSTVANVMEDLGSDTPERFTESMQEFLQKFDIDRIMICMGDNYETKQIIWSPNIVGDVPEAVANMVFWSQESVTSLFDKKGVLVRNKILPFEDTHPEIYKALKSQNTENFVAVKINLAGGIKMLVFFDVVKRHRKWSTSEEGLLYIAAWSIAQRYLIMTGK